MANLQVTSVHRDGDGDTTAICGPWGTDAEVVYHQKADAIRNITLGTHTYYVWWQPGNFATIVRAVPGPTGMYLRTDKDATTKNNLDELPFCNIR